MSAADSSPHPGLAAKVRSASPGRNRKDGWSPDRQLRFLEALARTRSVTRAATFAGMSREGAYRLRLRRDGRLFAALWDRILGTNANAKPEVHMMLFSDGRLERLLGTHFLRQSGNFSAIGAAAPKT